MTADVGRMTYFGYLLRTGQMPTNIKALIHRYHINMYDEMSECTWPPTDGDWLPVNSSVNNNDDDDDDAEPVQTAPAAAAGQQKSSGKVFKLRVPSLTRRLSKFGKRSSSDKNKAEVEVATSPSDSQLEVQSSAGTSVTTVDDCPPNLQTPPATSTPLSDQQKSKQDDEQRDKDLDKQKDKYDAGNCLTANSENASIQ